MSRIAKQQCLLFYNEMASIFIGLFENEKDHSGYEIHVVCVAENEMLIFSSLPRFDSENEIDTSKWIEQSEVLKNFRISSLRYIPSIFRFETVEIVNKEYLQALFAPRFDNDMDLICSQVHDGETQTFFVLLKNKQITSLPVMLDTLFDMSITQWRDCFKNGEGLLKPDLDFSLLLRPVDGDANIMIQSRPDYLEESTYFPIINNISSQYYEKSKSDGTITITESKEECLTITIDPVKFAHDNARQLRKLLEMTRENFSLLVHNQEVYGIGNPKRIKTSFRITGHMEWEMLDSSSTTILRYKNGNFFVPAALEMEGWYIEQKLKYIEKNTASTVKSIISSVRAAGHGSLLIISSDAENEVLRLCERKRGFSLQRKIDLLADYRQGTDDILKALSKIDGAVFLDMDGYCHGFGIILDGDAVVDGTPARGSRFNSAKNYVARHKKEGHCILAVVQSDDGSLDIIT